MKLDLEILASTSIKRKKPWPKLAFIGEVEESVCLLDNDRASVLYLPSGKTKNIPKLQSLLAEAVTLTHSDNGHFILGLLNSGDLFLWHKDTDMLKFVAGIPDLAIHTETRTSPVTTSVSQIASICKPSLYVTLSDDGSKVLVVVDNSSIYVWEKDTNVELFHSPGNVIKGSWSKVSSPDHTVLPLAANLETSVHAQFYADQNAEGLGCEVSFVFNHNKCVCVTSAVLHWYEAQSIFAYRYPTFTVEWNVVEHELSALAPKAEQLRVPGSYVCHYSHDGNLLAVAINQLDTYKNKLMFVSVGTDTVVVVDMKGMGTKAPVVRHGSSHWVVDLCWTADDLFVACVTHQGAVCILTRLGEPLMLQSHGCNIEMGPKPFLPLHPLISVRSEEDSHLIETEQAALAAVDQENRDMMRQRFSITVHSTRPVLLVSDGYMVTAIQLPEDITCLSLMKALVSQSSKHLANIRDKQKMQNMALFDSLRKQGIIGPKVNLKTGRVEHRLGLSPGRETPSNPDQSTISDHSKYTFEEADSGLNTTQESDITDFVLGGDMLIGKISFGDAENLNSTVDFDRIFQDGSLSVAEHMFRAQRELMLAWSLGASHSGLWTTDHEDLAHNVVHNLVRLFACFLHSDSKILKELDALQGGKMAKSKKKGKPKRKNFLKVLYLFKNTMQMLHLDRASKHLMVSVYNLISSMVDFMLNNKHLQKKQLRIQTLNCCYIVMRYCDGMLGKLYSHLPGGVHHGQLSSTLYSPSPLDLYSSSVLSTVVRPSQLKHLPQYQQNSEKCMDIVDVDDGYSSQPSARSAQQEVQEQEELIYVGTTLEKQTRLWRVWQQLYKHTGQHYERLHQLYQTHSDDNLKLSAQLQYTHKLLLLLQAKVQSLRQHQLIHHKTKLQTGQKMYLEGSCRAALGSWIDLLCKTPDEKLDSRFGSHVLHSVFYTMVLNGELRRALLLVESLIHHTSVCDAVTLCAKQDLQQMSRLSFLQQRRDNKQIAPVAMLTSKPTQQLVQTLARLMAAYFSNRSLFVYPPHAAKKLPSLHNNLADGKHRKLPLYHKWLSALVRGDNLSVIWTPERTLEYLMISGLYSEAVWFVRELGDWKTAFIMGVAAQQHQKLQPQRLSMLHLPESCAPENILKSHLQAAFFPPGLDSGTGDHQMIDEKTDLDQLTSVLRDVLLAAAMSDIDLVPWLIHTLVQRLKQLVANFSVSVPGDFYLPAPPIYCPQPPITSQGVMSDDVLYEVRLRRESSSVLVLLLLVLESSGVTLPAASWYAQKVLDAFTRGMKIQKTKVGDVSLDIQVLQEAYLTEKSDFGGLENDPSIHTVLSCFREICSITWMLIARDKLSLCLREKARMAEKKLCKPHSVTDDDWLRHCQTAINWTQQLLPFASFLNDRTHLHGNLLSLIIELPHTEDTAKLLAQHFSDPESCDPEIQEKLQVILKDWQGVFLHANGFVSRGKKDQIQVESPRGLTMSVFFHSNLKRAEKILKRKIKVFGKYENDVFVSDHDEDEQNGLMKIGSRYFESSEDYLEFLDVFYAVSLNRLVDREMGKQVRTPLLLKYSELLQEREFESVTSRTPSSEKKKLVNKIRMHPPARRNSENFSPKASPRVISSVPHSMSRNKGLFRSRSLVELGATETDDSKHASHDDLEVLNHHPKTRLRSPRSAKARKSLLSNSHLDRSMSMTDLRTGAGDIEKSIPDPLANPVVPTWMLDNMKLDGKFSEMEPLLAWLMRWERHNHVLVPDNHFSGSDSSLHKTDLKCAIRVSIPLKMLMYSLWLLENCSNPDISSVESQIPQEPQEITVAMARFSPRRHHKHNSKDTQSQASEPSGDPSAKRKKKKKKKKDKRQKAENSDDEDMYQRRDGRKPHRETSSGFGNTAAENPDREYGFDRGHKKLDPRKLSFRLPSEAPEDQQSVGCQSDTTDTLSVSSLRDEELQRTMEETMTKLQRASSHSESTRHQRFSNGTLNSTLRYQHDEYDVDTEQNTIVSQTRHAVNTSSTAVVTQPHRTIDPTTPPADTITSTNNSHSGSMAQELQGIVRQEIRKIMEAQHLGIVAMLGALDKDETTKPVDLQQHLGEQFVPNGTISNGHIPQNTHHKKSHPLGRKQDCIVMSVQEQVQPDFEKHSQSSEIEVTPLPSDELMSSDKPLSLSDLEKPAFEKSLVSENYLPQQLSGLKKRNDPGIDDAMKQLKLLEIQQVNSVGKMSEQDKENSVPHFGYFSSHNNEGAGNSPYDHLVSPLREVNQEVMWPLSGRGPQLLHINDPPSFHLPYIARPAWPATPPHPSKPNYSQIPLLPSHPSGNYKFEDIPERDTGSFWPPSSTNESTMSRVPFPLLRLEQPSYAPYNFEQDQFGVPRLIPPEDIINYEQQKYQMHNIKDEKLREFLDEQMNNQLAAQKLPEPIGKKLLMPDVFEPFGPIDQRDKKQRERHRKKKFSESPRIQKTKSKEKRRTQMKEESEEDDDDTITDGTLTNVDKSEVVSAVARGRSDTQQTENIPEDSPPAINHGYALTPGLFDEYVKDSDVLSAADNTNASVQYRAAMGIKPKAKSARRDTGTDAGIEEKDKPTTRETGTDPVSDAIRKYYEAKTGHAPLIPPDIYLGLRFDGSDKISDHKESQTSGARTYLNVVDIGAHLLDEITATVPDKDSVQPSQRSEVVLPSQRARSSDHSAPQPVVDEDLPQGPDNVTARLLGQPSSTVDPLYAEDVLYSSRRLRTKDVIHKKLEDMNVQFNAIDSMNANIEREFRDSELLLHTIEKMGEALVPEERVEPTASCLQPVSPLTDHEIYRDYTGPKPSQVKHKKVKIAEPMELEEMEHDDTMALIEEALGSDPVKQLFDRPPEDRITDDTPQVSARATTDTPQVSARATTDTPQVSARAQTSDQGVTGLSEEDIKHLLRQPASHKRERTEEQRKQLQTWMSDKQKQRQHEYKSRIAELREAESHPYKSNMLDMSSTSQQLLESETSRQHKKRELQEENIRKRQEEAAELMGTILSDRPILTQDSKAPSKTTPIKRHQKPGKGMAGKTVVRKIGSSRSPSPKSARTPLHSRTQTIHDDDRTVVAADDYMYLRDSQDWNTPGDINSQTVIFKPSHISERTAPQQQSDANRPSTSGPPVKPVRKKTLADIVRLQRPEVLRQAAKVKPKMKSAIPTPSNTQRSTARSTGSLREQQKLYGTKHIPGTIRKSAHRGPRQVKTYTERLSDIRKQAPPATHFVAPRPTSSRPVSASGTQQSSQPGVAGHRGISPRRRGKVLTYAEQLQQLQPPKQPQKPGTETFVIHPRPGHQWHKPPNKPKTYVQQLRELQRPGTGDTSRTADGRVYRPQPAHGMARTRPYDDPYSVVDEDRLSVVSPWSMDDDVRRILYDDTSMMEPPSVAASEFDISDLSSHYIGDEDYTSQVDIDEIRSVSGASIMSFIDWDQVDQLIADI